MVGYPNPKRRQNEPLPSEKRSFIKSGDRSPGDVIKQTSLQVPAGGTHPGAGKAPQTR